jgi:hypothetical protein
LKKNLAKGVGTSLTNWEIIFPSFQMTHFPSQQALTRRSSCLKKLHAQWHMEMA